MPKHSKKLEILHFNDVYNIDEQTTVRSDDFTLKAGASRFITAFNLYKSKDKLVIFSGDLFFPSRMSTYYEGE